MTTQAGQMLVNQIVPRLRAVIPTVVNPIGCEDSEELVQDSIVVAAQMLNRAENAGKTVTAGNIAYYTIKHMKSGRRSQSGSRADVMAPGTQLDQKSQVLSTEDEIGYDPELDEPITLHDVLSSDRDDPSVNGARNLDWECFIQSHDYRYGVILHGIASGRTIQDIAQDCHVHKRILYNLRGVLCQALRNYLGSEAIHDSVATPHWKADLMCREKW